MSANIYQPYRYWKKEEIEAKALEILQKMDADPKYRLRWPLDPTRVAEFLGLDTDIIDLDESEGIAAMIWPIQGKILINERNDRLSKGFQESSIAHEIGHWVLHVNRRNIQEYDRNRDLSAPIALHRHYRDKEEKGIEWQAQYFASCLLMPRFILEKKRRGRDLTNWLHLRAMAEDLGVTKSNLIHRLKDLEWIVIPENSRRIYLGKALQDRQS
ncbi:ImmA/IrrE family metallo-endopeptidase [Pannus brasiliensis CCIBt3594]|uniref:ImmA/IrrE family metallo-endopeptidase n=1 Tax=Pannus brasiliensis CCIBt3594 TaxID=1427578 RepID=A0AAW9QXW6_9CHRO